MMTVGSTPYQTPATRSGGAEKAGAWDPDAHAEPSRSGSGATGARATSLEDETGSEIPSSTVPVRRSGVTFDPSNVHRFSDLKNAKVIDYTQLPEDVFNTYLEREKDYLEAQRQALERKYTSYPETDYTNDARLKTYATMIVRGEVVTIDNQGCVQTEDNALGRQLEALMTQEFDGKSGPDLAEALAQQIAAFLGGRFSRSSTAMTQSAFDAMPPFEPPKATTDVAAMKNDPLYEQLQKREDRLGQMKGERERLSASPDGNGAAWNEGGYTIVSMA